MKPKQIQDTLFKTRHSLAHLLASVVMEQDINTQFGVGPVIENGFYYDMLTEKPISEQDLSALEKKMKKLIGRNLSFEREEISIKKARELFKKQPFKLELIGDIETKGNTQIKQTSTQKGKDSVSIYKTGDFVDLCQGPHVEKSGDINPDIFKLTKTAGAYWRGSEKNKMLTRIYGVAFESKKDLDAYFTLQREAAKRDHRVVGEKLGLFTFSENVGKGLPLWLPKGVLLRKILEDYMYAVETEAGYQFVLTPHLTKKNLYETSGHLAHYKDDMYAPIQIENEDYYLKPMNCPHHHMIYKSTPKSYKDMPVRLAEFGTVYRFERSGVLTGLIRTRGFTQNDAHIYCTTNQLEKEFLAILKMFKKVYKDFGIDNYYFRLSLPDFTNQEKYGDIKNKKAWKDASHAVEEAMKKFKAPYEKAEGEAAFYGPKIDVQTTNVFGKEDTIATVQVDIFMPERFDLTYIDNKGEKARPVIIHRAIMGSFERFFAFLIEKYAGAFPLWLAPEQIWIIPISKKHNKYGKELQKILKAEHMRVELKDADETMGKKIREGQKQKIPYMLIAGDKEIKTKSASVRTKGKDKGQIKIKKIIKILKIEIEKKK